MSKTKVKSARCVLREARKVLGEKWATGHLYRDSDGTMCVLGGINYAATGDASSVSEGHHKQGFVYGGGRFSDGRNLAVRASRYLDKALCEIFKDANEEEGNYVYEGEIPSWNDGCADMDDVLGALELAEKLAAKDEVKRELRKANRAGKGQGVNG